MAYTKDLFWEAELRDFLGKKGSDLKREIETLDSDYILNVSEEDLCEHLTAKYFLEPPALLEGDIYTNEPKEVDIDISNDRMRFIRDRSRPYYIKGVSVTIVVPFDGHGELFKYKPSTFHLSAGPRGTVKSQELHLSFEMVDHDAEKLKQAYSRELSEIKQYLEWVTRDIQQFNGSLEETVRQQISQRKKKLLDDKGLVSALGIPIKTREGSSKTYTIPTVRKSPKIAKPEVKAKTFKPEPTLFEDEYERILETIYNMTLVMERSPKTFSKLKEEEIRDNFLMYLNGQYEGQATGETFNFGGKTDILIRAEDKNVFIAECKFWRGEKQLSDTIDQLLGNTSWRDTKTAILLFNRNQDFSAVLGKINAVVKAHNYYKRDHKLKSKTLENETTFGYIFHQPNDNNRELILTVLAFDIPR